MDSGKLITKIIKDKSKIGREIKSDVKIGSMVGITSGSESEIASDDDRGE